MKEVSAKPIKDSTKDSIKDPSKKSALQLKEVSKAYAGTMALDGANFSVEWGEVHGLIGKNGAGKSTLVGILSGLVAPTSGTLQIGENRYRGLTRSQARQEGIAIVTQEPDMALESCVAENLFLGNWGARTLVSRKKLAERAEKFLKDFGLRLDPLIPAGDLSLNERQLLLILRACVVENPRIVVLDEAAASLNGGDVLLLRSLIARMKSEGKAVVTISHHIGELLDVCDRVTVLRNGRTIATKTRENLDPEVLSSLIVGKEYRANAIRAFAGPRKERTARPAMEVRGLTRRGAFADIGFSLYRGEVLGLAGLRGSGRTEILKSLAGIDEWPEGEVYVGGRAVVCGSPREALKHGVAYLSEEREAEGLINGMSVMDNLLLNSWGTVSRCGWLRPAEARKKAAKVFKNVELLASSLGQDVAELSGGNRQKTVVGRMMAAEPDVWLLDEPTRGVDIGAKRGILSLIRKEIAPNAAILLTSPGLDDLLDICDRILVLRAGRIVRTLERDSFDEERVFRDMQGVY